MQKILIVDDNPAELHTLHYALEMAGYRVFSSRSGEKALDLARAYEPALMLCDITMPNMTGFDVVRILKLDPRTKDIPVIFLTAREGGEDVARGFDVGADDYIKKPYNLIELLARIKRLIHKNKRDEPNLKHFGQIWLSPASQTAFIEGRKVQLSFKETLILNELMRHPGKTVTIEQLAAIALGVTDTTRADRHTIAVHVYNLRHKKLKLESTRTTHIHADGHRGYRLVSQETGLELTPADAIYIQKSTDN